MTYMAQRLQDFGPTIFMEITDLANKYGAINLGQGSPDFPGPDFLKRAAVRAIQADFNQYAPGRGQLRLREAIAKKMARQYGLPVDPAAEITVTQGATEGLFATVFALVNPGDEVILFEPCYDTYVPVVKMAGGTPRFCRLRPPHWSIDREELARLFSKKTRLLLLNNPHNPTGKVFSEQELRMIADLCQEYDVIAVTDEVYEHIVFNGRKHCPLAALPGMAGRTVIISSAGKTFSMTGWKVGWAIAGPELSQAIFRMHQFTVYSGAAPLQEAMATALQASPDYYTELAAMYQSNRDFLTGALQAAGLRPMVPQGTYFMMVDISHLDFPDDVAFCRYLAAEIGVAAIPVSAFYPSAADGAGFIRFAFCKTRPTLEQAAERLLKLKHR